jgi:hypothetical protein
MKKILYRDRLSGELITEQIFQENSLRWLYETDISYLVWRVLLNRKIFNVLYGKYQDSYYSRHRISKFIAKYEIDLTELTLPLEKYSSFNPQLADDSRLFWSQSGYFGGELVAPLSRYGLDWRGFAVGIWWVFSNADATSSVYQEANPMATGYFPL